MSNLAFAAAAARSAGGVVAGRLRRGPLRPGWSLRTELIRALMRTALDGTERWGIPWLRSLQATGGLRSSFLRATTLEPVDAGGVPAAWIAPRRRPDAARERVVVYYHGGGYVIGSVQTHRELMARLAVGCGARVLGVDYRLGPEHAFPAAHEDALAAWRWLAKEGAPDAAAVVAGDSAGGALCVSTCTGAREAGLPLPRAALLLSPWTDPAAAGGSMETGEPYDIADRGFLRLCAETYLQGADESDPRMTPLRADLHDLPPMLVQAGGAEVLLDQIRAFAERAAAAGVEVDVETYPDMFHVFQTLAPLLPVGRQAVDDAVTWLERRW